NRATIRGAANPDRKKVTWLLGHHRWLHSRDDSIAQLGALSRWRPCYRDAVYDHFRYCILVVTPIRLQWVTDVMRMDYTSSAVGIKSEMPHPKRGARAAPAGEHVALVGGKDRERHRVKANFTDLEAFAGPAGQHRGSALDLGPGSTRAVSSLWA